MSWAIFFCGTKKIAKTVHRHDNTYEGDPALILDWVFYHDVMYKFSIRHWNDKLDQQKMLAAEDKIVSKAVFSPLRQVVRLPLLRDFFHVVVLTQLKDTSVSRLLSRAAGRIVPDRRGRARPR